MPAKTPFPASFAGQISVCPNEISTRKVPGLKAISRTLSVHTSVMAFPIQSVMFGGRFDANYANSRLFLDSNAFNLIQRDFVAGSIIELCRSWALMGRDGLCVLDGSSIF